MSRPSSDIKHRSNVGNHVVMVAKHSCGPCNALHPIVRDTLAPMLKNNGVDVSIVDIDALKGVPTLLFFKDGDVHPAAQVVGTDIDGITKACKELYGDDGGSDGKLAGGRSAGRVEMSAPPDTSDVAVRAKWCDSAAQKVEQALFAESWDPPRIHRPLSARTDGLCDTDSRIFVAFGHKDTARVTVVRGQMNDAMLEVIDMPTRVDYVKKEAVVAAAMNLTHSDQLEQAVIKSAHVFDH